MKNENEELRMNNGESNCFKLFHLVETTYSDSRNIDY